MVVKGGIEETQRATKEMLKLIDEVNRDVQIKYNQFHMLIRSNAVNRLIGQHGSTIKQIIKNSNGAMIKVLSNRQSERDYDHSMVEITGDLPPRLWAVSEIIKQVEVAQEKIPSQEPQFREYSIILVINSDFIPKICGKNRENINNITSRT
jgi:hypothetical protein